MIDKNLVIGFVVVALVATSYVLVRAFRTGTIIEIIDVKRSRNPVAFWVYCGFAGWVIIACLQYLYSVFL
jgi:hypothetical protein